MVNRRDSSLKELVIIITLIIIPNNDDDDATHTPICNTHILLTSPALCAHAWLPDAMGTDQPCWAHQHCTQKHTRSVLGKADPPWPQYGLVPHPAVKGKWHDIQ